MPRKAAANAHLQRECVIELPYLDAGRRVFVATDRDANMIASGVAGTENEATAILHRLHDALDDSRRRPTRPMLTILR